MRSSAEPLVGRNILIASLGKDDIALICDDLEAVEFKRGDTVFTAGTDVTHITFPCDGTVASLIISMGDGRSAEAATIGREGAIGGAVSAGGLPAFSTGQVFIGGPALRIEANRLQDARRRSGSLDNLMTRYADCLLAQVLQSVACNALHPIEARCMRNLLTLQDQLETDVLPITQEAQAAMIGVQRTYLTRILRTLQDNGIIEIGRGRIRIIDRAKAEQATCECHDCIKRHYDTVMGAVFDRGGNLVAVEPPKMQSKSGKVARARVSNPTDA